MIKNIFWDVDGVLANLNFAYYNFLKNHPKYRPLYGHMTWEDLPKILPIDPIFAIRLIFLQTVRFTQA